MKISIAGTIGNLILAAILISLRLGAQNTPDPKADFKRIAADISTARLNGT